MLVELRDDMCIEVNKFGYAYVRRWDQMPSGSSLGCRSVSDCLLEKGKLFIAACLLPDDEEAEEEDLGPSLRLFLSL